MKIKLLISLIVICRITIAQPVILSGSNIPAVGETGNFYVGDATISPDVAGPNKLWDFSNLNVRKAGEYSTLNPISTPFTSIFPSATHCMLLDSTGGYLGAGIYSGYNYTILTPTQFGELSYQYGSSADSCKILTKPLIDLIFPFNYNESDTNPLQSNCMDSSFNVQIKYDSYGTLITPLGKTYNDVVRIKFTNPYNGGYYWWTLNPLAVVCFYAMDPDQVYRYTFFNYSLTTGINFNSIVNSDIKFLPNPFNTQTVLLIDYPIKDAVFTLYNSYGQQVKQIRNISRQSVMINRDNLKTGLYFFRLTEGNKIIAADKLVITD